MASEGEGRHGLKAWLGAFALSRWEGAKKALKPPKDNEKSPKCLSLKDFFRSSVSLSERQNNETRRSLKPAGSRLCLRRSTFRIAHPACRLDWHGRQRSGWPIAPPNGCASQQAPRSNSCCWSRHSTLRAGESRSSNSLVLWLADCAIKRPIIVSFLYNPATSPQTAEKLATCATV